MNMIDIFEKLLIQKINVFITEFKELSNDVFYDKDKQELIHPGEYGIFREKISKEFLKCFTPSKYDFGTGFVINTHNEISTQCDVIIYDPQNTPLIQDNALQTFYPVETIVSIGEIKSKLSKTKFIEALRKLAKIKEMREKIKNPAILFSDPSRVYNPKNYHYDQIFTFLICEKLDFDYKKIVDEFDSIYEGIALTNRHNLILSIEDGLICYYDGIKSMMYPMHRGKQLKNRIIISDAKIQYFKMFASYFFIGTSGTTILYPDISDYMGDISGGFNIDESMEISQTK
ncbi:MAG: hypothetical protein Q7T80_10995 [Methanoregula sp.]|nr:hypothetical protein [Methanoregula sp.]